MSTDLVTREPDALVPKKRRRDRLVLTDYEFLNALRNYLGMESLPAEATTYTPEDLLAVLVRPMPLKEIAQECGRGIDQVCRDLGKLQKRGLVTRCKRMKTKGYWAKPYSREAILAVMTRPMQLGDIARATNRQTYQVCRDLVILQKRGLVERAGKFGCWRRIMCYDGASP